MKKFAGRWGLPLSAAALFIVIVVIAAGVLGSPPEDREGSVSSDISEAIPAAPAASPADNQELLGVWVPSFCLTMNDPEQGEEAFLEQFDAILEAAKNHKMNALVVQVRPFADAFYPSDLFPWSASLTGEQGKNPGFDPLACMVERTHAEGLKFHAWVNPYRVRMNGVPERFSEDSLYVRWQKDPQKKEWCLPWEETNGIYLNPAVPEVREYITAGVREIVERYDVDGVQFDDYFYPTTSPEFDKVSYEQYAKTCEGEPLPLLKWRRQNVSLLVRSVWEGVHEADPKAVFGVSPPGNVENAESLGADVALWCREQGYVDYICPQLYYNFEHPLLPFDKAAQQWSSLVTCEDVTLYFGLGLYKASSDSDSGTWKHSDSILAEEVSAGRSVGCGGFLFYSCEFLEKKETREEVENVMAIL